MLKLFISMFTNDTLIFSIPCVEVSLILDFKSLYSYFLVFSLRNGLTKPETNNFDSVEC